MNDYEKAKAYDEVRDKIALRFGANVAKEIFSQFEESEDERIRKELIETIHLAYDCGCSLDREQRDKYLAWLEKGKQNPAWSKEDITNYSKVLFCLQTLTFPTDAERKELITWLKKQCEQNSADSYCQDNCKGFQETGKCFADGECKAKREAGQNIEEEFDDFFNLESVIDIVEMYGKGEVDLYGSNVTSELKWLKSLRDRVYWKPTEEQMSCFKQAIDLFKMKVNDDSVLRNLNSLYNDLKKL